METFFFKEIILGYNIFHIDGGILVESGTDTDCNKIRVPTVVSHSNIRK